MNEQTENIGARRLHTIMEKLLEDISYDLPDPGTPKVTIDKEYVVKKFDETIHADDIDRFIL
ncbi:MAG: ATP-dependent hsl protease ATP-binding subunit HslU [Firmicutes bacterium]|nr:ATP-dependent hsl protease ATP-binding subunit HslU [Bacillota bacterium]